MIQRSYEDGSSEELSGSQGESYKKSPDRKIVVSREYINLARQCLLIAQDPENAGLIYHCKDRFDGDYESMLEYYLKQQAKAKDASSKYEFGLIASKARILQGAQEDLPLCKIRIDGVQYTQLHDLVSQFPCQEAYDGTSLQAIIDKIQRAILNSRRKAV